MGVDVDQRVLDGARQFAPTVAVGQIRGIGGGLINQSWWVPRARDAAAGALLLQRINTTVFRQPRQVMENILRVTLHQRSLWQQRAPRGRSGRHHLTVVPTVAGHPWWVDRDGGWWRCYVYIDGSRAIAGIGDIGTGFAAGHEFGRFVADMATLPGPPLHETIPAFHHTPARLMALDEAWREDPRGRATAARQVWQAVHERDGFVAAFAALLAEPDMPRRVVHNDTKVDNLLFDRTTGEALCVVDLDTVMPGYVAHDFGDLVRNALGNGDTGSVDLALFAVITRGFVSATAAMLGPAEQRVLAAAGAILALELAARFLTDHLLGDRYFKIDFPDQNLERCRRQLQLLTAMERCRPEMEAMVADAIAEFR